MNHRLLLIALLMFAFAKAQSPVTTVPATPTQESSVKLVFNAVGTELENETGQIYAYTGVNINGERWQNIKVPAFDENNGAPLFVRTGTNSYELDFGMSIEQFYNVQPGDVVSEICLVVRNSDATKQTRPDIFLPVFLPGLNAVITAPENNSIYQVNETLTITAESSQSADLQLTVNDISIATANASTISEPYTFSSSGNYVIGFTADNGNQVASDNRTVFVPGETVDATRPAGLKNGVNENPDGSVTFLLAAPGKTDVNLLGSFTSWNLETEYQMFKDGNYFWITLPASEFTAGDYFSYQYLVNFETKIADPFSTLILDAQNDQFIKPGNFPNLPAYPTSQTTGDVTLHKYKEDPYNWTVNNFERPNNENLVIYELLVRDFSEEDSFQAIIDRIDYIVNLGVNAVEFLPLNEFEGTDSWGYNPKFHGALDKAYGTPDKFKELVDLLHSKGIAVIVDIVYNHAFGQSPLVQMWPDDSGFNAGPDNPYLNQTPRHPFNVGTDFNHESPWTKEYTKQTMQYFLDEFRIDGFRFDLSKGFTQTNTGNNVGAWGQYDQSRVNILSEYRDFILANNDDDVYLILEHLSDNPEEKALADIGFMLWGKMSTEYKQSSLGFSSNANVFRSYYTSRNYNDQHLVAYSESHDEQRIMYETLQFGNTSNSAHQTRSLPVALDRQEAIATILYTIPGPKMLWQFGELGYDIPIDQNGRTGRKPVPFTNGYATDADRLDLYGVTSELIKLKTKYPETFNNTDNDLDVNGLVKRITLNGPNFDVVVVANFDVTSKSVAPRYTQTGTWYEYFTNTTTNVTDQNSLITVEPGGYKLYSTQPLNTTASLNGITQVNSIQLYPNPASSSFQLSEAVNQVEVYNMTGQRVKVFEGSASSYDISDLASGMYIIETENAENNRSSIKLLKK
ncbi:alpha-amylase family glycosyl hydrolase [Nonlabens marinus]|uniref:1,4-alpha-glucan branching enzyme n=1 Tax=Nonlabens marinus S1-08 TaxID=1454201 RepID=W8VPD9_9FLAO|nr:alpha-amylase family glycosyl hydrolase [Nonlabens marinus]BAO54430.1 1,4-alpha-glucan branching enzyme [Nonlabens marinus S1-08]